MKDIALKMAARGFRVLPIYPGSKVPALENWQFDSYDAFDVYEQWPGDSYNVGIHCKGFVALDIDVKNGRNGLADLATLPPLPETFIVKTPSGGRHYYFKLPEGMDATNSSRGFPPGIDVRGSSGQCLAPGSVIDGKRYEIEKDLPPAPAPEWLLDRLRNAPARDVAAGTVLGAEDTPEAIERARAMLVKAAPAIEGQGGNNYSFAIACKVLDFGLSNDTAFEIMQGWNDRCEPPWSDDELERIIANARKYRQEAIGRDNPLAGMERVQLPPNPFGAGVELWDNSEADDAAIPQRPWIVPKRMMRGKITLLVAPGSIGKSLLTLQWAAAIALGHGDFCGLKEVNERTNTLVINMEDDLPEMKMRLAAACKHFNLPRDEVRKRVHLWSGQTAGVAPFTVARKDGRHGTIHEGEIVQHLIDYCRDYGIGVIIIDPLVDTHECNENDNGEVQRVMKIYRRVATELNCAVVLVHHTKKPPAGSSEGFAGSADAGRGASAAINAARIGITLFNMNQKEGERYNIPATQRHRYVRLDDAKANLFLASNSADWFRRESVDLPNNEQVGVLQPVNLTAGDESENRTVLEILAAKVTCYERYPVKTLARLLTEDQMFAAYTADGVVGRIVSACESSDPSAAGKFFKYHKVGKTGGDVTIIPANEIRH